MPNEEKSVPLRKSHSLILENRRTLTLTGVEDVAGFDEQKIVLSTVMGELTVSGENLKIGAFSHESGELSLEGSIHSLLYAEEKQSEGGFFSRIFR